MVHLTKHHPETQVYGILCWPAVVPLLTTRCLYWGWSVVGVSGELKGGVGGIGGLHLKNEDCLFQSTCKNSSQYIWLNVTLTRYIWKFEHTLHFMLCFTEVSSTKDHSAIHIVTCTILHQYHQINTLQQCHLQNHHFQHNKLLQIFNFHKKHGNNCTVKWMKWPKTTNS